MTNYLSLILGVHIAAGTTALVTGFISIVSKKGQFIHRSSGKVYFWSMLVVALSAALMSLVKQLDFFLMLSMFAGYAAFAGYRSILNKSRRANLLDWLMLAAALITCIFMIASGNMVLTIFGTIFTLLSVSDARDFFRKDPSVFQQKRWLAVHISRMMTAYIATTTAFLVVNVSDEMPQQLNVIIWLAPTLAFTPLILYFVRKYAGEKQSSRSMEINN